MTTGLVNNMGYLWNGAGEYIRCADSSAWDIFGSSSGDYTLHLNVSIVDASTTSYIATQGEDDNNTWRIINTGNSVRLVMVSGASTEIDISGGTTVNNTAFALTLCKIGATVGVYVNGSQVAYKASFTPDTFASVLTIGNKYDLTRTEAKTIDDFAIIQGNPFNAAPNATPDDTLTIDLTNPLGLVI